jgi:hypothetical protein
MTPDEVKTAYQLNMAAVGEPVILRRYISTGLNRTKIDLQVMARVVGYNPNELVGGIQQGDRRIIVLADDLELAAPNSPPDSPPMTIFFPIVPSDKVVVRGKELAIISSDDSTRRIQGVLIAVEIQARG